QGPCWSVSRSRCGTGNRRAGIGSRCSVPGITDRPGTLPPEDWTDGGGTAAGSPAVAAYWPAGVPGESARAPAVGESPATEDCPCRPGWLEDWHWPGCGGLARWY